MKQICTQIANATIERLLDEDTGFSDFLESKKDDFVGAIELHWMFMIAGKGDEVNEEHHRLMYLGLVYEYNKRVSNPIKPGIYRAFLELMAHKELSKLPIMQKVRA